MVPHLLTTAWLDGLRAIGQYEALPRSMPASYRDFNSMRNVACIAPAALVVMLDPSCLILLMLPIKEPSMTECVAGAEPQIRKQIGMIVEIPKETVIQVLLTFLLPGQWHHWSHAIAISIVQERCLLTPLFLVLAIHGFSPTFSRKMPPVA